MRDREAYQNKFQKIFSANVAKTRKRRFEIHEITLTFTCGDFSEKFKYETFILTFPFNNEPAIMNLMAIKFSKNNLAV